MAIEGMTCANCARKVGDALRAVPGVEGVRITVETNQAEVRWAPQTVPAEASLLLALKNAGYGGRVEPAQPEGTPPAKPASRLSGWRFNVVVGGTATAVLMLGEWVGGWGMARWFQWLAFVLALVVQVLCGARFYRGAWRQLKVGASDMDTLVSLGSTTAFLFSTWGLFSGHTGHLFFMEGAGIITLISTGHWMESMASSRAASALQALLNLAPPTARRQLPNLTETEVPVASLRPGHLVVLRPGDRVPTDGTVSFGQSAVDESMLTGESLPVEKKKGDPLYAGTINQNGRLILRVTATGEATALAHIIAVVEHAQNSRASIQRLGDRVSSVFVPIVVLVALGTGLWWGFGYDSAKTVSGWFGHFLWPSMIPLTALAAAIMQAVAVLIVACPCAMGLATPAAIMAGTNAAARRGILIRDGQALEKSGTITAVVFDKTGTLTTGRVECAGQLDLRPETGQSPSLAEMAAALAQPSSHPLSQAVARLAPGISTQNPHARRSRGDEAQIQKESEPPYVGSYSSALGAPISGWMEKRGQGVEAGTQRLGSLAWLEETGVNLGAATAFVETWASQGATILGLSDDGHLVGVLALRDSLKENAAAVVRQLMADGKKVFLATGDHHRTAAAIAEAAGIPAESVFAEVRPEQKAGLIQRLQKTERIAFVGDGINDAPALAQAELGIAVSRASDVAREAADIILLQSDIQAIPEALALAQATLRTIKQNLFWAFFYNAAAIPLAALGYLNPLLCAAAMGISDLVVIGNALRLYRWKGPPASKS
jgi:Cu+-exporting ATPase